VCCRGRSRHLASRTGRAHVRMHGAQTDHRERRAMSSLLNPIATSRSTSTSRSVSAAGRTLSASASSASAWSSARVAGLA
jgi:hypothetical protein